MGNLMLVHGLRLPDALVAADEQGRWQTPKDRNAWRALFPDDQIVQPMLYPTSVMSGESAWLAGAGAPYHGVTGEGQTPGDIDPSRTILIADLGPDRLVALDYRESPDRPSVIALTDSEQSGWVRVCDDIEMFMQAIGLIGSPPAGQGVPPAEIDRHAGHGSQ